VRLSPSLSQGSLIEALSRLYSSLTGHSIHYSRLPLNKKEHIFFRQKTEELELDTWKPSSSSLMAANVAENQYFVVHFDPRRRKKAGSANL